MSFDDLYDRLLGEVETWAGHTKHGNCNCRRTVASVIQRMANSGYRVLDADGRQVVPVQRASDEKDGASDGVN